MIETTYVKLGQAAAMLDTDTDTLLIAAAEGRIRMYWLLNTLMGAERGYWDDIEVHPDQGPAHGWIPIERKLAHFIFVPLPRVNAADLLKDSITEWDEDGALSDEGADSSYWVGANAEHGLEKLDAAWKQITTQSVFMSRADIEAIKSAHATPAPGTIKDAPLPRPAPRDGKLIETIAALLAAWPRGTSAIPSGKELEKAAQSVGLGTSDDTIRKALKAAHEIAPSLPLPK